MWEDLVKNIKKSRGVLPERGKTELVQTERLKWFDAFVNRYMFKPFFCFIKNNRGRYLKSIHNYFFNKK